MAITNIENFDNALTAYTNMFSQMFQGNPELGQNYAKYCFVDSKKTKNYEIDFLEGFPMGRKWNGKKVIKPLRANKIRFASNPYEASVQVSLTDMKLAPELVASQVYSFISSQINFINHKVVSEVLTQLDTITGYDGVAVASTSHPRLNGLSNQSNTSTTSFSLSAYKAASQAMRGWTDAAGRPLGVQPAILVVGPDLFYKAQEVLNAKVFVRGINASNVVDGATAVAAGAMDNVVSSIDGVQIVLEPLLKDGTHDYNWFLFGKSSAAPSQSAIVVNLASAPEPKTSESQWMDNAVQNFGIEAHLSLGCSIWQLVYAGLATS